VFHGLLNLDSFVTFVIKKHPTDVFPVALDLANEPEAALGLAIMPDVPASLRKEALAMDDELTNLCYAMKGRRYLYGYHNLTREQVVQHYGADVIAKWNKLKQALDPKRLLNVGVVEHLDEM
jgi:FAD/FMN-containing dehydrogenase